MTADLVLQSTGAVAEHQGHVLGLYRQVAGRHNGKVYFQQLDGVTEGYYLYWNKKWNGWRVGDLDGTSFLRNNQDTDQPPSQGINGIPLVSILLALYHYYSCTNRNINIIRLAV